ncbi:MAG TPA: SRPBCC domain-containing protein [Verrucomicrobiae bacterium]|nr:SRPBCC domain-containing protein [Verrucomicrobiae bacterium]
MTTMTLPSDRELVFAHVFDAPRALVFEVMYDPKHIPNWWGPRRLRTVIDTLEFRPGGKWRFLQYDTDGTLHAFRGEYLEIEVPEYVTATFEYEPWPGKISRLTHRFTEKDGRTTVTSHQVFETREDRDMMVTTGAQAGYNESMERLAELLAEELD